MKAKGYVNPYISSKSSDNAGKSHSSGIPAQMGIRMGTFTVDSPRYEKAKKAKPPRKMN